MSFVSVKHTKMQSGNQTLKKLLPTKHRKHHDHLRLYCFLSRPPYHRAKIVGQGEKIVVGTVVKAKLSELEEEVRVGSSRGMRKELTGVFQGVSRRRRFLVRFQNGYKKNLSSNQLTVVTAHEILVEEAPEVFMIPPVSQES